MAATEHQCKLSLSHFGLIAQNNVICLGHIAGIDLVKIHCSNFLVVVGLVTKDLRRLSCTTKTSSYDEGVATTFAQDNELCKTPIVSSSWDTSVQSWSNILC